MKKYYTNSDIFNSYIEISEKRGLVKIAEETESDKSKAILDKNPRADSLTKEKIGKLYNLEINTPKEMKYERNIVELAHPKPKYIHTSYDKLNGLVENVNERQDIMLRIVNKRTSGAIAQHKYAQDEIVRALVRIANDMDNRDEEGLRSLADECITELKKNAFSLDDIGSLFGGHGRVPEWLRLPAASLRSDIPVMAIAGVAAAILGAPVWATMTGFGAAGLAVAPIVSWMFGMAPIVKRIHENCEVVLDEMDDFSEEIHGVEKRFLDELKEGVIKLKAASENYYNDTISLSDSHKEGEAKSHLESNPQIAKSVENLKQNIESVKKLLTKFDGQYQAIVSEYRKEEGFSDTRSRIIDWFSPIISGLNPVLQLSDAIESLKTAISNFENDGKTRTEKLGEDLEKVSEEASKKIEEGSKEVKRKLEESGESAFADAFGLGDDDREAISMLMEKDKSNQDKQKTAQVKKLIHIIKNS